MDRKPAELDWVVDASTPLRTLSPTRFDDLRSCPRRVELKARAPDVTAGLAPAAALGIVAHETLEALLRSNVPPAGWESDLAEAWDASRRGLERSYGQLAITMSAERRTLARLRQRAIPAITELLVEAGAGAVARPEVELSAFGDRLRGRVDLHIAGDDGTLLVDYKSGLIRDEEGLRPTYENQLTLYAAMLKDSEGHWPDRTLLLSLRQGIVEIPIDRSFALSLAEEALALLDEYDSRVPATQPANPSPQTCGYCDVSELCTAFWDGASAEWVGPSGLVGHAVAGLIRAEPERAINGVVALFITIEDGTLQSSSAVVTGLRIPDHAEPRVGDRVRIVNLRSADNDGNARGGDWTRIALVPRGEHGE